LFDKKISLGWIGFSDDDAGGIAEGANIRRQSRVSWQRVEDNAFHLITVLPTLTGFPELSKGCHRG
jgi:hypothetical protein